MTIGTNLVSFIAGIGVTIGVQLIAMSCLALWCRRYLYDFLAPNHPLETSVLIVEGWVPDPIVKQIATLIEKDNYTHIIISGLPLSKGSFLTQYTTHAEVTADTLSNLGIDRDCMTVINCPDTYHYRTQSAAQAIYNWLADQNWKLSQINLCTAGAHARRSWLTYRRIFVPEIQLGIISLPDGLYEPSAWWQSSAGFRSIVGETIAHLYVRWLSGAAKS